jgi:phage-related protein
VYVLPPLFFVFQERREFVLFLEMDAVFDDIYFSDMGLTVISDKSGAREVNFGFKQNIIEEKVRDRNYFYRVDEEALSFSITVLLDEDKEWSYEKRREIINWLFKKEYKIFRSLDFPNIAYYCIATGDAKITLASMLKGYFTINFRCDASHGWSYPVNTQFYDLSNNDTYTILEIENIGNIKPYHYPEVEFLLQGDSTGITIQNLSDSGRIFEFTNLTMGENIYVDNDKQRIITSLSDTYRLDNFNKNWLRLVQGANQLKITGKCTLQIRCQFPIAL